MPYAIQSTIPEDDCAICSETLKDPSKAVFRLEDCGHFYHNDCLNNYCKHLYPEHENEEPNFDNEEPTPTCPLCRADFDQLDCITFDAFKDGYLQINSLPQEIKNIYFTLHPEQAQEHEGGKRKRNKSKRHNKKGKRIKRKTIKHKRFRIRPF